MEIKTRTSSSTPSTSLPNINIPIWNKYSLTIKEASMYFNIGEKKIRQIVQENNDAQFILYVGNKTLIKRVLFEEFLNDLYSV